MPDTLLRRGLIVVLAAYAAGPKTRPNVLVGIRTPRSLRSRHFWMEINRAGGYVSVAVGLVMIVAAAGLELPVVRQISVAVVLAAVGFLVARYRTLART